MKPAILPSGLQRGIPLIINAEWSAHEALAVVELLDDLREVIWRRYEVQLFEFKRQQQCPDRDSKSNPTDEGAEPF
jgi:hypothetical protein